MPQDYSEDWRNALHAETRARTRHQSHVVRVTVPGLTILCHPDPARIGERSVLQQLVSSNEPVRLSRAEPAFSPPNETLQVPLTDHYLSRTPLYLSRLGRGGVRLSCEETRTAVLANGEAVSTERDFSASDLEQGVILSLAGRVALLLHCVDPMLASDVPYFGLVGESASMVQLRREIRQVADLDVPVLIQGETGTGKELAAQAVHQAGLRRDKPFVAVNMGAIPPSLAAAELFGAAKGAYTGANTRRVGYFNRAQGGTLFLDEVGEMPPDVQPLLLRALESHEIQAVGAELPQSIDVRILAATDAKLTEEIGAGKFREPLYHRLSGYEIHIAPLRERRDDFGRLLVHFLRQELEAIGETQNLISPGPDAKPWLSAELVARLAQFEWPGNVRQLKNVVRQLVIGSRGETVLRLPTQVAARLEKEARAANLSDPPQNRELADERTAAVKPGRRPRPSYRPPSEVGEVELQEALKANRWRLKPTAATLGISRPSLYLLLQKFPSVRAATDLTREEIEASSERCDGSLEAMVEDLEVSVDGLKRRMKEVGLL